MKIRYGLYRQILKTYWQRPLVLLLSALFLSGWLMLVWGPTSGDVMRVGARPRKPGPSATVITGAVPPHADRAHSPQTFADLLERTDPAEIRSLYLSRLNDDDPLPDLRPFRNLVFLNLSGFELTADEAEQICQLPRLDSLELLEPMLHPGVLERVGRKVSQLELLSPALESHADEIPQMTQVKLLAVHLLNTSPAFLEQVTRLPVLEQLTLLPSEGVVINGPFPRRPQTLDQIDLSPEQLALLRDKPTLNEVYANWFLMRRLRGFTDGTLLPVRALPTTYSKYRVNAFRGAVFLTAILFGALALQLWAHFITPAARLTPDYLAPHRRLAVGILVAGTLLISLPLLRQELGVLPALSLTLFLPALGSLFLIAQLSRKSFWKWAAVPLVMLVVPFLTIFSNPVLKVNTAEVIWYLRGHLPWQALMIITGEVLCIAWLLIRFPVITEQVHEASATLPDFSPWNQANSPERQGQQSRQPLLRLLDPSPDKLHLSHRSIWQMARLWRLGNAYRPRALLLPLLAYFLVFGLMFQGLTYLRTVEPAFSQPFPLVAILFSSFCGIGIFLPPLIWRQRLRSMASEALHPVSRTSLVKQLYLGLALDHCILVTGLLLLVILALYRFDLTAGSSESCCLLLLVGLAAPLWIIGTNAAVIVFQRAWIIVGSMFGLYVLAALSVAAVLTWYVRYQVDTVHAGLFLMIATFTAIVVALGLNVLMYRTALKREWG
ncbi:hypothetical protein Pan153_37830 [Gimesia panareensis]|uniref:Uncharacterized protein n=1 Tax=Gimesia panareensis TaxID=2527978 RepID=A0A518FS42_9PLAN|nr:hypothetical protein [Gimesia panareensis]QDV19120.1 hypothetical protein Pan153_37830 [Gimesia panareensis]